MESVSERWLPVKGFEGIYEVSDQGRVRSLDRILPHNRWPVEMMVRGRLLSPRKTGKVDKYLGVQLSGNGIRVQETIHKLVMQAFIGNRPHGMQVNHKNGIQTDNRLCNLEYVTPKQNIQHAIQNGRWPSRTGPRPGWARKKGFKSSLRILDDLDVKAIRVMKDEFPNTRIAKIFGCSEATIRHVLSGRGYTDVQ